MVCLYLFAGQTNQENYNNGLMNSEWTMSIKSMMICRGSKMDNVLSSESYSFPFSPPLFPLYPNPSFVNSLSTSFALQSRNLPIGSIQTNTQLRTIV